MCSMVVHDFLRRLDLEEWAFVFQMLCRTCEAGVAGNGLVPNLGKPSKLVDDKILFQS